MTRSCRRDVTFSQDFLYQPKNRLPGILCYRQLKSSTLCCEAVVLVRLQETCQRFDRAKDFIVQNERILNCDENWQKFSSGTFCKEFVILEMFDC